MALKEGHDLSMASAKFTDVDDDAYVDQDNSVDESGEFHRRVAQFDLDKFWDEVFPDPSAYNPNSFPIPVGKQCDDQDAKIFQHYARKLQHGHSPWFMHLTGTCMWKHFGYKSGDPADLVPQDYQQCLENEFCKTFADWYDGAGNREKRCISTPCAQGISAITYWAFFHVDVTCRKTCRQKREIGFGWTMTCRAMCESCTTTAGMDDHLEELLGTDPRDICNTEFEMPPWAHEGYICVGNRCPDWANQGPGPEVRRNGTKSQNDTKRMQANPEKRNLEGER